MANLTATKEVTESKKTQLRMHGVELTEGQTLKDIPELMNLADKTVPTGKIARITLIVRVDSITDAPVVEEE